MTRLARHAASSRRSSTVKSIGGESRPSLERDLLEKVCISPREPPLYHLPTELIIEILSTLADLTSLRAAILSCKAMYQSYLAAPHLILSVVTARDIGLSQVDADAVANFDPRHLSDDQMHDSKLPDLIDDYRTALGAIPVRLKDTLSPDFFEREMPERIELIRRTVNPFCPSQETPQDAETNLHSMRGFDEISRRTLHVAVRSIAEAFYKDTMPLIPGTGTDVPRTYSPTSEEEHRLFRALYRFELYCRIFCNEKRKTFKLSSEEKALLFLFMFTTQEAEEIASVYLYIHQKCRKILPDLYKSNIYGK